MKQLVFLIFAVPAIFADVKVNDENVVFDDRILGGTEVKSNNDFPYQANIKINNGTTYCGGSIIGDRWILTAAHCLAIDPYPIKVILGTTNFTGHGGDVYEIANFTMHEKFEGIGYVPYDVALIRLDKDIVYSERVQPIPLNFDPARPYENEMAIVTGWGQTKISDRFSHSKLLKSAQQQVINKQQCLQGMWQWQTNERYYQFKKKDYNIFKNHTDNLICTHADATHCKGDSGGPLVINGVQVGIVFGSARCSNPGLFTRVSSYADWIQAEMKKYIPDRIIFPDNKMLANIF